MTGAPILSVDYCPFILGFASRGHVRVSIGSNRPISSHHLGITSDNTKVVPRVRTHDLSLVTIVLVIKFWKSSLLRLEVSFFLFEFYVKN